MTAKTCTCCKIEKPLSEFHHFGKDNTRVGKWCEACFLKKKGSVAPFKGAVGNTIPIGR